MNITTQVHKPKMPDLNAAYNFDADWRSYANTPGHGMQLTEGGEHQKVWEIHAASRMTSGSFTALIGLKSGYIFRKVPSHSLFNTFVRT
ncbi:hypothetical protein FEM33_09860 [Dyadobacter flavalbus]|uniref:Uncharacterized protein n=1 Tax=Dyadobacter flavalbus TaxID=2579942 RepID=A0A5M8QXV9_9BACT|nr:hypothetical protein FEM33_09860 [Dyadobacter flavalbus]